MTASIENLAEKVEDINGLKNSVTESVESLAAIAQENAAGTEETSASMVELSQIVNDCNQNTSSIFLNNRMRHMHCTPQCASPRSVFV